jgi:outer membrane receptor protein involved in Fe transport
MKNIIHCLFLLFAASILGTTTYAQSVTITGSIKSSPGGEPVQNASVTIKGATQGTVADADGNFKLTFSQPFPVTLVISAVNYATKEVVLSSQRVVNVELESSSAISVATVTASTRTPIAVLESPVSIETVSRAAIRNVPSPSYYDAVGTLKGVDITTSSFAFKTPSTRGFNGSGNLRFNQLVDGMDNQAPALNFAIGSIVGLTELDVENMELLPGASSALYGSGGMNGTLLINSKSPFKYQGLSFQIKQGINHVDSYERSPAPFYDWSVRWAKKVSEKFAFKIGAQFVQAQDWQGTDTRNLLRNNVVSSLKDGDRTTDANYDGVNVFGDEASASMQALAQFVRFQVGQTPQGAAGIAGVDQALGFGLSAQTLAAGLGANPATAGLVQYLPFLIPTSPNASAAYKSTFLGQYPVVSRTGYQERDLVDYNAYNVRLSAGLNYKITNDIEASFLGYFGTGTSVYTGADRYALKNLKMGQYKLELRAKNWFLRAYTTQENSGDSYTATTAALYINNAWKSNTNWFQQYTGVFGAARLGILPGTGGNSLPEAQAHPIARGQAETGRYQPGTAAFNEAFQAAINTDINNNGAKFADKSSLYHYEGQLNLSDQVKFAEVLLGASFRHFVLNSNGTIFEESNGPIGVDEYGGYLQVQKKLLNEVLKLTGSIRYDKNQNFEGRFTPRLSALIKVAKDNNIRLSFQTAYRFPSTQDQYINLLTGGANRLIGGLPYFNTFFKFNTNPAYTSQSIVAYRNSFATGTPNPALLQVSQFPVIKPETVKSYEIGYKALWGKKLLVDVYGYYSKYVDFLGRAAVGRGKSGNPAGAASELASPFTTDNYSFVINSPTPVKAIGYGIGFEYNLTKRYIVNANAFSDKLRDVPAGLITFFNTPKIRYNLGFSNSDFHKGWGFNINYRWQDKIDWEGTFGAGEVPAYGTADVMISYKITNINSLIKVGATNLWNKYYRSAFGNPQVGGLYYVSFGYNIF